jgi:hypothetical protein
MAIFERLLAAIGRLEAVIYNQVKIGAEMKTNQEEVKAQVSYLAPRSMPTKRN